MPTQLKRCEVEENLMRRGVVGPIGDAVREDLIARLIAAQKALAPNGTNPPVGQRSYVLGIIDGNDAVHSVIVTSPGQVHEDFWPLAGTRRWRYAIWAERLALLYDAQGKAEYRLNDEEVEWVRAHLRRKGFRLS